MRRRFSPVCSRNPTLDGPPCRPAAAPPGSGATRRSRPRRSNRMRRPASKRKSPPRAEQVEQPLPLAPRERRPARPWRRASPPARAPGGRAPGGRSASQTASAIVSPGARAKRVAALRSSSRSIRCSALGEAVRPPWRELSIGSAPDTLGLSRAPGARGFGRSAGRRWRRRAGSRRRGPARNARISLAGDREQAGARCRRPGAPAGPRARWCLRAGFGPEGDSRPRRPSGAPRR